MKSRAQIVREYINANPEATTAEVAKKCKVTTQYVYQVKSDEKKRLAKKRVKITATQAEVAKRMGVPLSVYANNLLPNGKLKTRMQASFDREPPAPEPISVLRITTEKPKADNVNHPPHYKTGGIETIDFIEAKELGYHLGNVIKYVTRAKHKGNELEDLKKAQWYLERAIMKLHI